MIEPGFLATTAPGYEEKKWRMKILDLKFEI